MERSQHPKRSGGGVRKGRKGGRVNDQHKHIYRFLYSSLDGEGVWLTDALVELVNRSSHDPSDAVNKIVGAIRLAAGEVSTWISRR